MPPTNSYIFQDKKKHFHFFLHNKLITKLTPEPKKHEEIIFLRIFSNFFLKKINPSNEIINSLDRRGSLIFPSSTPASSFAAPTNANRNRLRTTRVYHTSRDSNLTVKPRGMFDPRQDTIRPLYHRFNPWA